MEYYLFIDESGDPSLSSVNEDFPIFVLSGCLFSKDSYIEAERRANSIKERFFQSRGVIFHSRDIRKCEGAFSRLFDLDVKRNFYEEIEKMMLESGFISVAVGIKKHEFIDRYGKLADDPYELSLTFLLERFLMATDVRKECRVKIIIESRGKKEDATLSKRYDELLWRGSGKITPKRFQDRFVHKLLFRKKRENDIGLQVADLCAYPISRHILSSAEPYPAFDIVKKKLRRGPHGCNGYGLKIFP